MANSDVPPSGAEMRSPNDDPPMPVKMVCAHCGATRIYAPGSLTCAVCHYRQLSTVEPEVSPRSSGGALDDDRVLSPEQVASMLRSAQTVGLWETRVELLCDSHESLRTQVSALRQQHESEMQTLGETLRDASVTIIREQEAKLSALRQEAATLTRQRDKAAATSLDSLNNWRDSMIEVVQERKSADDLRRAIAELIEEDVETWPHHGNAPVAIAAALALARVKARAARQEAETLRGQLEAAQKDAERLDWLAEAGEHYCNYDRVERWGNEWMSFNSETALEENEPTGNHATLREAIDAARVAAPREPK